MKTQAFALVRYDADDGKVFDWKEERFHDLIDSEGNVIGQEQEHLYAKTLFIGGNDNIDNYIEVNEVIEEK